MFATDAKTQVSTGLDADTASLPPSQPSLPSWSCCPRAHTSTPHSQAPVPPSPQKTPCLDSFLHQNPKPSAVSTTGRAAPDDWDPPGLQQDWNRDRNSLALRNGIATGKNHPLPGSGPRQGWGFYGNSFRMLPCPPTYRWTRRFCSSLSYRIQNLPGTSHCLSGKKEGWRHTPCFCLGPIHRSCLENKQVWKNSRAGILDCTENQRWLTFQEPKELRIPRPASLGVL